jgi:NAD(P)-dependent dehydrogenase (short-subunit alcohol dehydrogenase family)
LYAIGLSWTLRLGWWAMCATAKPTSFPEAGDLSDTEAAPDVAARATQALAGCVDILVNSAGTFPFEPTASHDEATFDAVYALNVKAPWFPVAALAPSMAAAGSDAIVNVSTMVAQFGMDGMASGWSLAVQPVQSVGCSVRL